MACKFEDTCGCMRECEYEVWEGLTYEERKPRTVGDGHMASRFEDMRANQEWARKAYNQASCQPGFDHPSMQALTGHLYQMMVAYETAIQDCIDAADLIIDERA